MLASFLQAVDPKTDGAARDWVAIYDECANVLYQEIDYRKEGENADAFRRNFAPYDWAKIPHIFWEYRYQMSTPMAIFLVCTCSRLELDLV